MLRNLMMEKKIKFDAMAERWHSTIDHALVRVEFMMNGTIEGCEGVQSFKSAKSVLSRCVPRVRLPKILKEKDKVIRMMAKEQDERLTTTIQYEKWSGV